MQGHDWSTPQKTPNSVWAMRIYWGFNVLCALAFVALGGFAVMNDPEFAELRNLEAGIVPIVLMLGFMVAVMMPSIILTWSPRHPFTWGLGVAMLGITILGSCFIAPVSFFLLFLWFQPEVKQWFGIEKPQAGGRLDYDAFL